MAVLINAEKCTGCGVCVNGCPVSALRVDELSRKAVVDPALCIDCGTCISLCRKGAIIFSESRLSGTGLPPGIPGGNSESGRGRVISMPGRRRGGAGRGRGAAHGGGCGGSTGAGANTAGECLCPVCGRSIPHAAGVPCSSSKCPDCGSLMVRK